jgi:KDO2-lipid IV(A) lauroyltransferase|tara:strand:- start:177 stop:1043 length:867 start_codon:yes stop_codon:yes gene_type:complete
MKIINHFFQFVAVITFFFLFKIMGIDLASFAGSFLGRTFGPFFRSKKIIKKNLQIYSKNISESEIKIISENMWSNIGRTFSEYVFLNKFKPKHNRIEITGLEQLDQIKKNNKPVIFVSGHFANFELMAMRLHDEGVKLAAIYRPLNNKFLNPIMEYLRKKYICPNQIKKGKAGLKELLDKFNNSYSIALMIDQRVSEGIKVDLFNQPTFTTTIPAQLAIRYKCNIVPIYIERLNRSNFKISINNPLQFNNLENNKKNIEMITMKLNKILEEMINKNPGQWIWSHNKWK